MPERLLEIQASNCPVRPVSLGTQDAMLVTRAENVRAVLSDPEMSADVSKPGFPVEGLPGTASANAALRMVRRDAPDHPRLRRLATGMFTVRNVQKYRPIIEKVVERQLQVLEKAGHGADLVSTFALPVPSLVISALLGIPARDVDFFQARSAVMVANNSEPRVVEAAQDALIDYFHGLVREKQDHRGDDLLSRLIHEDLAAGKLTYDELIAYAVFLLVAGHETTGSMIGLSTWSLMQEPELVRHLSDDRQAIALVDELLRFHTITRVGPRRVATKDKDIGGTTLYAGQGVIASAAAANHDPSVHVAPHELRPGRPGSHLAFGFGQHQCLGQHLARLELQIVLRSLFERFPDLRVADPTRIRFSSKYASYSLELLSVTWGS